MFASMIRPSQVRSKADDISDKKILGLNKCADMVIHSTFVENVGRNEVTYVW